MMNRLSTTLLATLLAITADAQGDKAQTFGKPSFSGYIMGQYQATLKDGDNSNSFSLRMARVSITGRILNEFEYKVQGQINGNTSTLGESPRLVDAFVEWQRHTFFKIKTGQFKRPFTFENPMHPIDQGFMGYSQNVSKLAGFSDRSGEQASNGRDIGLQVQGDFLRGKSGRNLLHYQVGVFNGQGINTKDVDNKKDIIGGLWGVPATGVRVGAFGWTGSKARNGIWTDGDGQSHSGVVSLNQHRYAISAEYKDADWQIRSEYIHSTGFAFKTTYSKNGDQKDATVNDAIGNKADGFYALCIAPVVRGKLRAKARYDLYRQCADWTTSRSQYEVGLNWLIDKNLSIHAEYALINDRTLSKHNYSLFDVEFNVKF